MFMSKSPNRDPDAINLFDDADRFFRARAVQFRRHIQLMERRIRSDEITTWEKKRLRETIEKDEVQAQYWEDKADNYTPKF